MIRLIENLLTGYRSKYSVSNGLKIKILYRGKLPSSDPLLILREVGIKLETLQELLVTGFDFESNWKDNVSRTQGKFPNSIATFKQGDSNYKVARYVLKENNFPMSVYSFSCDNNVFGFFSRRYDFGKYFTSLEDSLFSDQEKKSGSYLIGKDNHGGVVDFLGHSQFFIWNDREALDRCLACIR